jgi:hydroxypyruvate reductase
VSGAREQLARLYRAAVAGADVESLTSNAVSAIHLDRRHRVWVFAIGKAAHRMAAATVATVQRSLADVAGGIVIAPDAGSAPNGTMASVAGDHPIPGARSFAAASKLQDIISRKRGTDVGIVLLSGGASSLMAAPLRGMQGADLTALYELLLGSGLDIAQMNVVRKRFTYWSAGRLALGLAPAQSHCFALSDVPGDDLAVIGSGPCFPDPSRAADVVAILEAAGLHHRIAPAFRRFLADSVRRVIPETPKATHPAFAHMKARVIGNNAMALEAVATEARALGLRATVMEPLTGDALRAGETIAAHLVRERESLNGDGPSCIIWGGETTMTLPPGAPQGGRCQAVALAAAQHLAGAGERAGGIALLAAGTDGRDGTTAAAGAIVDASTIALIRGAGIDPAAALGGHDSHRALAAAGALFTPGITGTNVMDVAIGLIQRQG